MDVVKGTTSTVSARSWRFLAFIDTITTGRLPLPGGSE
jgi:hypothetical protein